MPETMADLAGRIFAALEETLFSHEAEARLGDVDAVHDMRVTTRRLRVAMSNFAVCMPREVRREMKLRLEQIADALGRVRDLDVMLEALATMVTETPDAGRIMTAHLAGRLRRRRRYHLRRLNEYFDGANYQGLKVALEAATDSISASVATSSYPHFDDGQTIQDQESIAF